MSAIVAIAKARLLGALAEYPDDMEGCDKLDDYVKKVRGYFEQDDEADGSEAEQAGVLSISCLRFVLNWNRSFNCALRDVEE